MTRQESSDLFRWLLKEDRIGDRLAGRLLVAEIEEICSLIEGSGFCWVDEIRDFNEHRSAFGIGTQPRLGG